MLSENYRIWFFQDGFRVSGYEFKPENFKKRGICEEKPQRAITAIQVWGAQLIVE
jgi:hypothetical protein